MKLRFFRFVVDGMGFKTRSSSQHPPSTSIRLLFPLCQETDLFKVTKVINNPSVVKPDVQFLPSQHLFTQLVTFLFLKNLSSLFSGTAYWLFFFSTAVAYFSSISPLFLAYKLWNQRACSSALNLFSLSRWTFHYGAPLIVAQCQSLTFGCLLNICIWISNMHFKPNFSVCVFKSAASPGYLNSVNGNVTHLIAQVQNLRVILTFFFFYIPGSQPIRKSYWFTLLNI